MQNIHLSDNCVFFSQDEHVYFYTPMRGRLSVNIHGDPVHESRDGSFCFSTRATLEQARRHAVLLGAVLRRMEA